jgi:hypothetical protein
MVTGSAASLRRLAQQGAKVGIAQQGAKVGIAQQGAKVGIAGVSDERGPLRAAVITHVRRD